MYSTCWHCSGQKPHIEEISITEFSDLKNQIIYLFKNLLKMHVQDWIQQIHSGWEKHSGSLVYSMEIITDQNLQA